MLLAPESWSVIFSRMVPGTKSIVCKAGSLDGYLNKSSQGTCEKLPNPTPGLLNQNLRNEQEFNFNEFSPYVRYSSSGSGFC